MEMKAALRIRMWTVRPALATSPVFPLVAVIKTDRVTKPNNNFRSLLFSVDSSFFIFSFIRLFGTLCFFFHFSAEMKCVANDLVSNLIQNADMRHLTDWLPLTYLQYCYYWSWSSNPLQHLPKSKRHAVLPETTKRAHGIRKSITQWREHRVK